MTLEVSDRVAEEIAWRNGELIFTNLPLQEIAPPVVQHIWRRYLHNRHCFAELPDHGTVLQ